MKRYILLFFTLLSVAVASAQLTARQVLDKAAAKVSSSEGVTATFKMSGGQYGQAAGSIAVKGRKFKVSTAQAVMWFDGKTMWTYVSANDEVNISSADAAQQQTVNPYNFINMYKQGYNLTMTATSTAYKVHCTAKDTKRSVGEMYITVAKKSFAPTEVKMKQDGKWTTISLSGLSTKKLSDAYFRFSEKDYPNAEIIDLR